MHLLLHIAITSDEKVDCIVPAECRFYFEMRALPDDDTRQVAFELHGYDGVKVLLAILARLTQWMPRASECLAARRRGGRRPEA